MTTAYPITKEQFENFLYLARDLSVTLGETEIRSDVQGCAPTTRTLTHLEVRELRQVTKWIDAIRQRGLARDAMPASRTLQGNLDRLKRDNAAIRRANNRKRDVTHQS